LRTPEASDSDEDLEVVGAPVKKRRVLPWTEEGRKRFGLSDAVSGVVESEEASVEYEGQGEELPCGQHRWWNEIVQLGEEVASYSDDSGGEDDCKSFVVSDDSESLADEVAASEESLGREALEDERLALVELVSRLERRLAKARSRLGEVELDLSGGVVSETQLAVADTQTQISGKRRRERSSTGEAVRR
jgi:hypothetical protein